MTFHPYLNFAGNCGEAFIRYHEIFGGELDLMKMSDIPEGEVPADQAELVAHAALIVGDSLLMGSDAPGGEQGPVQNMYVNFSTTDVDDAKRVWESLAEGGQVEMPAESTFWSPYFGICVDRYGTPWMVNVQGAEPS